MEGFDHGQFSAIPEGENSYGDGSFTQGQVPGHMVPGD